MQDMNKHIDRKHKELAPLQHWYLASLVVAPEYQGKGFASKLVKDKLTQIDHEGLACYVETEGEKNVSMYKHFGFELLEEFNIPDTPIILCLMLRQANSV